MDGIKVHTHQGGEVRCPFCHDAVGADERVVSCGGCATRLHTECAREVERCPALGCDRPLAVRKAPRRRRSSARPSRARAARPEAEADDDDGEPCPGVVLSIPDLAAGKAVVGHFGVKDPERAGRDALGCGAFSLGAPLLTVPLAIALDEPGFAVAGALVALFSTYLVIINVHAWLAARRVGMRFLQAPRSARPGESFPVSLELEARRPARVDVVRLVLACVEAITSGRGKSRSTRYVVHHHEQAVVASALVLRAGERQGFEAELRVPPRSPPTRSMTGDVERKVFWVLGAHADIPGWPDYQRSRGLIVLRGDGASRQSPTGA